FDDESRRRFLSTLESLFTQEIDARDGGDNPRSHEAVALTMREAVRLLELGDEATATDIRGLTASLQSLARRPDTLRRFAEAIGNPANRGSSSAVGAPRVAPPLSPRFGEAMWRLQAGAFQREVEMTEAAIAEHTVVDSGLLHTGDTDPRDLHWLAGTHVRLGALALWEDGPITGPLRIAGTYGAITDGLNLIDSLVTVESFPPWPLISSMTSREVCVVIALKTTERDWGILALVADVEPATTREAYQHWAALLCAALESQRLQEAVSRSALFDPLTGLPNRQLFVREVEHSLAQWRRSGTPFAVLFLDLDGFKLINDSFGHHVGDLVLKAVGEDIQRELRSVDTAARFGGDEFVILLANTEPEGARLAALRVQAALAAPHRFDEQQMPIGASVGVATSRNGYASAEAILRDADAAMYRAKDTRPGTTVVFDLPLTGDDAGGATSPAPG
ncbi:MAG: GGDEF domain-containing protein, partial [Demequinaceae bacterium]|nr:GGDEF domain-containing protein [Demequinaceae bacterium]